MSRFLERIRDGFDRRPDRRQEIRDKLAELTHEQRVYVQRLAVEIWSDTGDVQQAEESTTRTLQRQGRQLGLDPATILAIIQILLLMYRLFKEMGLMNPSAEVVTAIFEPRPSGWRRDQ
jgi:hypothetical protein